MSVETREPKSPSTVLLLQILLNIFSEASLISLVFTSSFLCREWTSPEGSLKWLLGRSLTSLDGGKWMAQTFTLPEISYRNAKTTDKAISQCSRKRSRWGQCLWCRQGGDYELTWKTVLIPNRGCAQIVGTWTRNISPSASHTAPISVIHLYHLEFLTQWRCSYLGPTMDWTEIKEVD